MGRLATMSGGDEGNLGAHEPQTFDVLKELTRHGYVPDTSDIETSGILLRHDHAPDLVLRADGRLELPAGQKRKGGAVGLARDIKRMSWRRTLMIVALAGLFWILAVYFTVSLLESGV